MLNGERVGGRKGGPVHVDLGYHMEAFAFYLQSCGSLKVILNRIVELVGNWVVDRKIECGEIERLLDQFRCKISRD